MIVALRSQTSLESDSKWYSAHLCQMYYANGLVSSKMPHIYLTCKISTLCKGRSED